MSRNFFPSRESELLAWSLNFKTLTTATPTAFGLTAPLATAYGLLHDSFATLLATCSSDATRTPAAIAAKNTSKKALIDGAGGIRALARIVQATASVTVSQKVELGLNPHDSVPTPIPAPTTAPKLSVASGFGRTLTVKLEDATGDSKRARPAGVAGASVFSAIAATAPTEASGWTFEANVTRTSKFVVEFPEGTPAGTQVWLCAFWYSPRGQSGPPCAAVGYNIAGAAPMAI